MSIDRERLAKLIEGERTTLAERTTKSRSLAIDAQQHMIGGVPMQWMNMMVGRNPLFFERAKGNRIWDVDGTEYLDFCLGDTGAMAGHSPDATVAAVQRRIGDLGGITTMLPTEDSIWVANDLSRRFGMAKWTFSLTATDANRWVLRTCRQLSGKPKIMVFSYSYHGSVDETIIVLENGVPVKKPGNVGPAVDPTITTRVAEFNDLEMLARELSYGDVACVLAEPALTNMGIVLPDEGYWEAATKLIKDAGAFLVIDETHSLSAGPGGCTKLWGLQPDIVTIGKSIAGGIPMGAYGVSTAISDAIAADRKGDYVDTGGVGGTLAGNAMSLAAARGTLQHVLTDDAFVTMCSLGAKMLVGMQSIIERYNLPWVVEGLGCRAEFRFCPTMPRNGTESHNAHDDLVEQWLHLATLNKGLFITPFHNMCLVGASTTEADVDRLLEVLDTCAKELMNSSSY
jgi:glutamate-1-semialdehyde 2,1-aminomutase